MRRLIRLVAAVSAVLLLAAPAAQAQYEKTKSTLAISEPVEVPGAVLEPGTYLVRVANIQANRNVVVFQNMDGTKTFATCLATPHRGASEFKETEFDFYPMPAGQTRVLRSWFPANVANGQDFYYPAERAAELKRITSVEVPVATAEMNPPAPAPPAPEPVAESAPAPAPPPAPEPPAQTAAASTEETNLPQTASPYPLVAILGAASLAVGAALHLRRRAA